MNNERDELRGTISNTICNAMLYPERAVPYLLGGDMSKVLDKTAEAILAAGYRKPQQVTTVEELKALRLPAIIDSPAGGPARVDYYAGPGRQQRYVESLFCDDDSDTECYSPEFFATFGLPATVLHVGGDD